jgi:arginine deiminase
MLPITTMTNALMVSARSNPNVPNPAQDTTEHITMASKINRLLEKWIRSADDPEELADELTQWFEDASDDEIAEMTLTIATKLMPDDDGRTDNGGIQYRNRPDIKETY